MRILVVAPHADDETIGMGGTIARYVAEGHEVVVAVVTGHGSEPHPLWPRSRWDAVRAEMQEAMTILGVTSLLLDEVPAALVADLPVWELNAVTRRIVEAAAPDVVYVPFPYDLHKDHREVFHSFSVAWRPTTAVGRAIREVYCYEVLSETHWNIPYVEAGFLPVCWVDITEHLETKMRAVASYATELQPSPSARSLEAISALATLRGHQVGFNAAEAFVAVRLLR